MIVIFSVIGCVLALTMTVYSGIALYHAEVSGRNARPYVLPVFVGVAYVTLRALELTDGSDPARVVEVAGQFIETMLIISVILLLHRGARRGG